MANLVDMDDQKAGGSTESLFVPASLPDECGGAADEGGASGGRESSRGSTASSPGRSNSLFHSSRTTTTDESLPRRSGSREGSDATTDPNRHDASEDFDDSDLDWPVSSIGIQTDYDEDFPPLEYLRVPPMALPPDSPGQQNPPVTTIVPPTSTSSESTATTSCSASEGTLQLVIQNFRNMTDTVRGPSKYIQNVPWRIMVMPRQHVVQKKGTQKCLGFFLQCCPEAYSESWSCSAAAELRLISQKQGVANFTRKTNHVYTAKENDWGYSCFMTWADILDESQGYIKEDRVILEVSVKAEPPKNILTHKEFEKKIQDYKRIADIQCQRGLIDKAIECNSQALKFCKDKDPHCKADLEAQKAHLIDMKLKQSIERIEKGGDPAKTDDENANLNALRHAIGSTTRSSTKQKTTKSTKDQTSDTSNKTTSRTVTPPPTLPTAKHPSNNNNNALNRLNPRSKSGGRPSQNTIFHKNLKSIAPATLDLEKENNTANKALAGGQFNKKVLEHTKTETEAMNKQTADEDIISRQLRKDIEAMLREDEKLYFSEELDDWSFDEPFCLDSAKLSKVRDFKEKFKALQRKTDAARDALLEAEGVSLKRHQLIQKVKEELANASARQNAQQTDGQLAPPPSRNATTQSSMRSKAKKQRTADVQKSEFSCQTEFAAQRNSLDSDISTKLNNIVAELDSSGSPPPPTKQRKKAVAKKTTVGQRARNTRAEDSDNSDEAKIAEAERALAGMVPLMPPNCVGGPKTDMGSLNPMDLFAGDNAALLNSLSQPLPPFGAQSFGSDMRYCPYYPSDVISNSALSYTSQQQSIIDGKDKPPLPMPDALSAATAATPPGSPANVYSRQYIEEWLRYNTRNLWKFNAEAGRTGGVNADQSYMDSREAELNQTMAALSVIGVNCINTRTIMQKVMEFMDALESHTNFRELRSSVDRLISLCGDEENYPFADDSVSIVSISESRDDPEKDLTTYNKIFADEDAHDYMLSREAKRVEMDLATRLQNIVYQLHPASLADVVDRLESRMIQLEEELKSAKAAESALAEVKAREARIAKTNAQLQQQVLSANEKLEKLNAQMNERKKEIKKLEKKAKSEAQLQSENTELHEKVETLTKELAQVQRQINEEQLKYKRDTQSLADSKKHLHVELNARYAEVQKLTSQLEEKTQALKKSEQQLANERKSGTSTVAALTERAKKAEVNFLEHKLEDGLRVLERARDDCQMQIRNCEEQLKKYHTAAETDVVKKNMAQWQSKQDEVVGLINQAKTDFSSHISALKAGKQLSQLPKIQVPKPPPCPKLFELPPPPPAQTAIIPPIGSQTPSRMTAPPPTTAALPMERKVITPPKNRVGATTPQQFTQPPPSTNPLIMSPSSHYPVSSSQNSSANVTPIKPPGPIAPIGVRPQNYQNGMTPMQKPIGQPQRLSGSPPPMSSSSSSNSASYGINLSNNQPQGMQQSQQQPPQQQQQQQPGQFVPWGWNDPLNNISDFFGPSRSFGPLGSDFGGSPAARMMQPEQNSNSSPSSSQLSQTSTVNSQPPQHNGWNSLSSDAWNSNLQTRPY